MGRELIRLVDEASDLDLAGAVEAAGHPLLGSAAGSGGIKIASVLPESDVAVDFSLPEGTARIIAQCVEKKIPLVIGTTGLDAGLLAEIEKAGRTIAVSHAPNWSVGVNLTFRFAREMALALGDDYDAEIVEIHHHFKKDAPSGTALKLAQIVAAAKGIDPAKGLVNGRTGIPGARPRGEVGIHAVRGGDVTGEHTLMFISEGERVELVHKAHARTNFARGALRAARVIAAKSPGVYSVGELLFGEQAKA